jgi:hypothetical protein
MRWKSETQFSLQQYQAGFAAGEKNSQGINFTSWACPPGQTRAFCLGWNQTSCNSVSIRGASTLVSYYSNSDIFISGLGAWFNNQ